MQCPGAPEVIDFSLAGHEFRCLCIRTLTPSVLHTLTATEKAVAMAAGAGHSARSIAGTRGTSVRTVEHQIATIFRKLGVRCRAELYELLHVAGFADE